MVCATTSKLLQIPYIERIQCRFYVLKNMENDVHYRRGGNLPPATWQLQPVWLNGTTPRHVIPSAVEESSHVAIFILWLFLIPRSGFLHSACATVGMTQWGTFPFFIGNGSVLSGAGGRLPMELWCDCPRQSIDFDSLREAPPLQYICSEISCIQCVYHGIVFPKNAKNKEE